MKVLQEEQLLNNRGLFEKYLSGKEKDTPRYESFDLCYHHFRTKFRDSDTKIIDPEKSCAILSAYLASWGMMRGSSFLFKNNYRILRKVIDFIAGLDESYWEIDVDNYPENYERILEIYREIKNRLVPEESQDKTLVTKIMLGVFGMVPAFDQNFTTFMREQKLSGFKFYRFNKDALESIYQFYKKNKDLIENLHQNDGVRVIDFNGKCTDLRYSTAKVIDMIGFIGGGEILEKRKKEKQAEKKAAETLGRTTR